MTRRLAAALAAGALLGAGFSTVLAQPDRFDGCIIRWDSPPKPRIHANGTHTCTGVTGVSVAPGGELITYGIQASSIKWMGGSVDESSLRGRVATVGPRGGIGQTAWTLRDYAGRKVRADDPSLFCSTCNVQLGWVSVP